MEWVDWMDFHPIHPVQGARGWTGSIGSIGSLGSVPFGFVGYERSTPLQGKGSARPAALQTGWIEWIG